MVGLLFCSFCVTPGGRPKRLRVAETAAREWDVPALLAMLRAAYPYRELTAAELEEVLRMLAEGYSTRRGRHVPHQGRWH